MYFCMLYHKKIKTKHFVEKIKKKFRGGPPLTFRGMKNRCCPIRRPNRYAHKISRKSVEPFRRSLITNTVTREFYILDIRFN